MLLDATKPYKILIVQTGRIGDLILVLPLVEALKEQNPNHTIHLLTSRHNHEVLAQHPLIERVHVYKKGVWSLLRLIYTLRQNRFDIWIDPKAHKSGESRMLAFLGGASFKIGYEKKQKVYDYILESDELRPAAHMSYLNMLALKPLGIEAETKRPRLYLTPLFEAKIQQHLAQNADYQKIGQYMCVNLSGSNDKRSWETEKWIAFLKGLPTPRPYIVIIASPRERERAEYIASVVPDTSFLKTDSITDTFGVIAHARLVITPDTSIVHIAAAFDKPIVAMYINVEHFYKKFFPLSSKYQFLMGDDGDSITNIPIEEALEAYKNLEAMSKN